MAAPATIDDFLTLLRRCEVVDGARLEGYWKQLQVGGDIPDRPYRLARKMVADGMLTKFHAEQLLRGKSHGYSLRNYRILERIGRGGMGTVYLAEHQVMRHRVAIKVLPSDQAANPTVRERFFREARSAAALSHPHLIRAHDIDEDNGVLYIVMEYVDGVTLQDLVTRKGRLSAERAAHFIGQAAVGLQYAHEVAGLVHRDIKPGNLLLDRSGIVKILDLGLARMALSGIFGPAENITKKYNDRSVLGTADYIAPEQAVNSQAADGRADIYSLGATYYFLLTGAPPFPTGSIAQKLVWHQIREPAPVDKIRPDVPADLADFIRRMMAKDPADRPQTVAAVVEELRPWIEADVLPPTDDEIPAMCLAVQGPGSNGMSNPPPPRDVHAGRTARTVENASTGDFQLDTQPLVTEPVPADGALSLRESRADLSRSERTTRRRRWWFAAAILVALGLSFAWWHVFSGASASAQRPDVEPPPRETPHISEAGNSVE